MANKVKFPVYVFDSFALLSYFNGEKGSEKVKKILETLVEQKSQACLSVINLGEVLYIVEREQGINTAQKILCAIEQLPIFIQPVTSEVVFSAAHIKANYSLSYADSFAAVTCIELDGILLTGDPEFKILEKNKIISIDWITSVK